MPKFPIIKTGTRADGMHWTMISKKQDGFGFVAMLATEKPNTGKELDVPEQLVKLINWKL
jgi:hypothetical protein